jgi:segregation and condensation protein B
MSDSADITAPGSATATDPPAPDPQGLLEAILFSGGSQITVKQLIELTRLDDDRIVQTIARLNQRYFHQARPYEIRRSGEAYQMILRPQFARIARRLMGRSREVRLSVAAIEVLALVAYLQPTTLRSIDAQRGVDSGPIVRQLRRRNLIELAAPPEGEDRSEHFRTTKRFLQLFQLASLDDLPRVQDLEKA